MEIKRAGLIVSWGAFYAAYKYGYGALLRQLIVCTNSFLSLAETSRHRGQRQLSESYQIGKMLVCAYKAFNSD